MPFTVNFPKPLVPLGDTPVLEVLIRRLIRSGITDITLTLGHLAELVKAYFDHRRRLAREITLRYVEEEEPTGTAGFLALVPGLDETFLVMNGDLLTNLDFNALVPSPSAEGCAHHRHSYPPREDRSRCWNLTGTERVTHYLEKPEATYYVSMGIYVYEPGVLKYIERGCYL